jgi:protein-S-isoprenylcysteine O-methyltransferase Ste14
MIFYTRLVVLLSWAIMLSVLTWRHLRMHAPAAMRAQTSRAGLLLQAVAYAGAFGMHPNASDLLEQWRFPVVVATAAMILAVGGAATVVWCQRVLGVQWSLTARLVEGHRLVISGPYARVRHPIYAAMVPMLAATAVAFSSPLVLLVCLALYIAGTRIRISAEEHLMASAFGEEWTTYRQRVPALVPFPRT